MSLTVYTDGAQAPGVAQCNRVHLEDFSMGE